MASSYARVQRQLRGIQKVLRKDSERVVREAMEPTVVRARQLLQDKGHVKSGRLRDSLVASAGRGGGGDEFVGSVGSDLGYAAEVEELPDGGFLFQASEETSAQVLRGIGRGIERSMRRGVRS